MSFVAVDIGATNIRVASGDSFRLLKILKERTDRQHGPEGIPAQIARMVKELVKDPKAVGIGSIGPLNIKEGSIGKTPNYPFKNIPIVDPLQSALGIPVKIMNDCSAGVLGEHNYGAGRSIDNLFYITMSTGIGGGAIVDGHLLRGRDGNAPEIGHIVIDPNSKLKCGCGCRGHWEAYCSGSNIPKFAKLLLKNKDLKGSILLREAGQKLEHLSSEILFSAASRGDSAAAYVMSEVGKVNAVGFADITNTFDPELITVGGSVAINNWELIIQPILRGIDCYLINKKPEIRITSLGDEVVLYGAMALAMEIGSK